jgi:hypothetical protein
VKDNLQMMWEAVAVFKWWQCPDIWKERLRKVTISELSILRLRPKPRPSRNKWRVTASPVW